MSIWRGMQSAIFYYVACTPCADARYRKKRRQEALRDKADRDLLESQMPNLYRHPEPSSTNPHWETEIALGPALVRGKRKPQTSESQRGLNTRSLRSGNGSAIPSSVDLPRLGSSRHDSKANGFGPVQREDEELWGSVDGSSIGGDAGLARPAKASLRSAPSHRSTSTAYRNPAISELHPATVTKVDSKQDVAWMLQPPPTAAIMSGKEQPKRLAGSSRSVASTVATSRQVSELWLESGVSRENSGRATYTPSGQRHDRHTTNGTTEERDFAAESPSKREKRSSQQLHGRSVLEDSAMTILHPPSLGAEPAPRQAFRKVASRPLLSPIVSDNIFPQDDRTDLERAELYTPVASPKTGHFLRHSEDYPGTDRDPFAPCSAMLIDDDSLTVLQKVPSKNAIFNTKIFDLLPEDTMAGSEQFGSSDADRDEEQQHAAPELFDSWYTPDFELDTWVHEHTKREGVTKRWSMDF